MYLCGVHSPVGRFSVPRFPRSIKMFPILKIADTRLYLFVTRLYSSVTRLLLVCYSSVLVCYSGVVLVMILLEVDMKTEHNTS